VRCRYENPKLPLPKRGTQRAFMGRIFGAVFAGCQGRSKNRPVRRRKTRPAWGGTGRGNGAAEAEAAFPCGSELFVTADGPDGSVTLCAHCDSGKLTTPIIKKCSELEAQRQSGMSWDEIKAIRNPTIRGGAGQILRTFDADRSG
jgi:hypothetical protein